MGNTLEQVAEFIVNDADAEDIDRIIEAVNTRRSTLRQRAEAIAAASVKTGARVELHNLTPKYLNGLTGTVTKVDRGRKVRATVKLDEASTKQLRWSGARRFFVSENVAEYELGGVPVASCKALTS
ncbi:hypothetical protein [Streptomyces subrutilus]|uniref:Uncharacterized protein n=1 Tax=Streptomyces subrutilus TaxID=36818 RepID=A0A1E5NXI4_9ACTN|nr:hypothetical protein [Streptomyces subrutilus]OEJ20910.1 hypothetical protein BGK67_35335 [Streptomyces subrutilus]